MFGLDREATAHLFLFLILWSFVAGVCIIIGKRKGIAPIVAILGSFPLWLAPFFVWMLRQPDIHPD